LYQLFGAKAPVFVPFWWLQFWAEARPDELRSDWSIMKTGSLPGAKVAVAQPCAERFNIVGVSEHIIE